MTPGQQPVVRLRRWRATPELRALVRETRVGPEHLVAPLFVVPGEGVEQPVASLPGVARFSADKLAEHAAVLHDAGVRHVMLFGVGAPKDPGGASAWDHSGPVPAALRALRAALPGMVLWADACLCAYTDHGHCGVVSPVGEILNDPTVERLCKVATCLAEAGAHAVVPSDMMDGRVAALRAALDAAGHAHCLLVSHAAKHASSFYGPFRDAADSAPSFGDRRTHQLDPANRREALREMAQDVAEGADMLLVKPGLPCLDLLAEARARFDLPLAVYHVSGEWAMLRAAAERGWIDGDAVLLESLVAMRRAGADAVITYGALDAARLLA